MSITWTPWNGGECPVGEGARLVLVQTRGKEFFVRYGQGAFGWQHQGDKNDITAYCIITPYVEGAASQTEYARGYKDALADAEAASKSRERVDALVSGKEDRDRFDRYVCAVIAKGGTYGSYADLMDDAHALMTAADAKMKEVQP